MSIASASVSISYTRTTGTCTMSLLCRDGDIVFYHTGTGNAVGDVTNSINNLNDSDKPVIDVLLSSSALTTDADLATAIVSGFPKWYVNGDLIAFGSDDVSTGAEAGLFKQIKPDATAAKHALGGLKLLKDPVAYAQGLPLTIRGEVQLTIGATVVTQRADYIISIRKMGGASAICDIYAWGTSAGQGGGSFVLDETTDNVTADIRYYKAAATTPTAVAAADRVWSIMNDTGWVTIASGTPYVVDGKTVASVDTSGRLNVTRDAIQTYGIIRCEVRENGALVASDVQNIADNSDMYVLYPNPTPADLTFIEGDGKSLALRPEVRTRANDTPVPGVQFSFAAVTAAGFILNTDSTSWFTTTGVTASDPATYTVPAATIEQGGEGLQIIVNAKKV